MTPKRQNQRAGEGSNQIQVAGNLVMHQGVTEERAKEIALDTARSVASGFADEARDLIHSRIAELDDRVVTTLATSGSLSAFADPAFTRAYRKAQEGAAASERELDYDLLATLIAKRVENPRERPVVAGIDRAIEITDRVDEDALRGLTAAYAFAAWIPRTGSVREGLMVLDRIFERILDGALPQGLGWLDHLDVLDAVRLGPPRVGGKKTAEVYYGEVLNGYVAPGVQSPGPEFIGHGFPNYRWDQIVVDHELKPGFRRINVVSMSELEKFLDVLPSPKEFDGTLVAQAAEVFGLGQEDEIARKELRARIAEMPHLGPMANWWDTLKDSSFQLTSVGQALAQANCVRLDPEGYLPRG
jgi:hypothetical protein